MSVYQLTNKTSPAYVDISVGTVMISIFVYQDEYSCTDHYTLSLEHTTKLENYKSVNALVKFAKANHNTDLVPLKPLVGSDGQELARSEVVESAGVDIADIAFLGLSIAGSEVWNQEIIEVALVDAHENVLFHSLFRPSKETYHLDNSSMDFYGIDWYHLIKGLFLIERWVEIQDILKGKTIAMHVQTSCQEFIAGTYHRVFSVSNLNNRFERLFPNCKILSVMDEYRNASGLSYKSSSFEWIDNSALHEQGIVFDDLLDNRALASALKSARLYTHMHGV